jgi:Zn finger protein HypA/HybF involved in hydrogenase expression
MQEHPIANNIIEEAESYGEVKSVRVEVGDLAQIPPDEMKEILEDLTDWKVEIIPKTAIISCKCGYNGVPKVIKQQIDSILYECPICKAKNPEIVDGNNIILQDVEIYSDDEENLDDEYDFEEE